MINEQKRPDMRHLWQGQAVEGASMSLNELRSALAKLNRVERARTLVSGLFCLMFSGACGALLTTAAPIRIVRGGECFFAIGAALFFVQLILGLRRAPGRLPTQESRRPALHSTKQYSSGSGRFTAAQRFGFPFSSGACLLPVILLAPPLRVIMIPLWILLVPFWVYESTQMTRRSRRELDRLNASLK
jgi:hypothetical protein